MSPGQSWSGSSSRPRLRGEGGEGEQSVFMFSCCCKIPIWCGGRQATHDTDVGEEEEGDEKAEAEGFGEESWSSGDWSRDHRGDWEWSMDFTSGKAAGAELLHEYKSKGWRTCFAELN